MTVMILSNPISCVSLTINQNITAKREIYKTQPATARAVDIARQP